MPRNENNVFTFTADNGYTVEFNAYNSAKVLDATGAHIGGFAGPAPVWAARHDRVEHLGFIHFEQQGRRGINVGSCRMGHADAMVTAVRDAHTARRYAVKRAEVIAQPEQAARLAWFSAVTDDAWKAALTNLSTERLAALIVWLEHGTNDADAEAARDFHTDAVAAFQTRVNRAA